MDDPSAIRKDIEELYRLNSSLYMHLAQMISSYPEELNSFFAGHEVSKRNLNELLHELEEVSYLTGSGIFEVLKNLKLPLVGLRDDFGDGAPSA